MGSAYLSARMNERVTMKPHDERSSAHRHAERRVDAEAVSAAIEAQSTSVGCEVMLKVLPRDDTLRASYVRRRWQGLNR
jgi:hypothetical protein